MVQYKLNYFNGRGRAELVRWVFAAAGQEYEDVRFERDQWPNYKPKSPTGQAPFLEVNDNGNSFILCQSVSIARFLARRHNLAGKGEQEQAEVDMYADQISDFMNEMAKSYYEKDEAKKKELEEKFATETVPNNLKIFEARLAKTGSGFAASGLSYADLYLSALLEWFADKKEPALAHFPHVKKLDDAVHANAGIAAWLAKRPVTAM